MSARRSSWRFQRRDRPDPRGRGIVLYDFEGDLLGDDPEETLVWVGHGERIQIGGYTLTDPMVYAGMQEDIYHPAFEPSAIDPAREVAPDQPPRANAGTYTWQPWGAMTPTMRGAYLAWIATGRRDAGAPDSFPSLYLCGLERRLFTDLGITGPVAPHQEAEVRAIRDEVAGLVDAYGPHLALGNATRLLALLNLVLRDGDAFAAPPRLDPDRDRVPLELSIGLGILVAAGEPIPPDWALAWAWYRADMPFTSTVTRCPDEVQHLFLARYRQGEGAGISVRTGLGDLSPVYDPLNAGVPRPRITVPGLPDVFLRRGMGVKLSSYVAWVCHDLEPYARWLARNPTREGTTMSLLHVPALLLESDLPAAHRMRTWLALTLGEYEEPAPGSIGVVPGTDLITLWGQDPPDRLTKGESEMLAQVLERFGAGMEPDIRFEGAPLTSRMPVAIFRAPDGTEGVALREPSTPGEIAALVLVLGAPLLTTDDPARTLTNPERSLLSRTIGTAVTLSPLESMRVQAAIARISPLDPKPSGLKRRLDVLHAGERERIGDILVRIAAEGRNDLPLKVVTLLQKQFRTLRLDPADVPGHLHAVVTAIPSPLSSSGCTKATAAMRLDQNAISRTQEESEAVSALLGDLLNEEIPDTAPRDTSVSQTETTSTLPPADGLDTAHSAFLRDLVRQERWTTADAEALAATHHLLLAGAIDALNEWALDIAGEPLIDGDIPDFLSIDPTLLPYLPL
ncbi:MAG: TerB N-terminal domain-containing protein [Thermomicrobiales bacterium]